MKTEYSLTSPSHFSFQLLLSPYTPWGNEDRKQIKIPSLTPPKWATASPLSYPLLGHIVNVIAPIALPVFALFVSFLTMGVITLPVNYFIISMK